MAPTSPAKHRFFTRLLRWCGQQVLGFVVIMVGLGLGWLGRSWTAVQPWSHSAVARMTTARKPPAMAQQRSPSERALIEALKEKDRPLSGFHALRQAIAAGEIRDFAAVRRLLEASPFPQANEALGELFRAWAVVDPAGALDDLILHSTPWAKVGELTGSWLDRDHKAALSFLRSRRGQMDRSTWASAVGAILSQAKRPDAAERLVAAIDLVPEREIAQALSDAKHGGVGKASAWQELLAKSHDAQLRQVASDRAVHARLAEQPRIDTDAAVAAISEKLSPAEATALARRFAFDRHRGPEDLAARLTAAETMDSDAQAAFLRLATASPATALQVVQQRSDLDLEPSLWNSLSRLAWTGAPGTAASWLAGVRDAAHQQRFARHLGATLTGPLEQQWAQAQALGAPGAAAQASVLARAPAETAWTLLQSQPAAFQAEWGGEIAAKLAPRQPAEAASIFSATAASRSDTSAAVQAEIIAEQWVTRDAAAAAAWVGSLPPGPLRERATVALVKAGTKDSPDTAAQWKATLTDPGARAAVEQWESERAYLRSRGSQP